MTHTITSRKDAFFLVPILSCLHTDVAAQKEVTNQPARKCCCLTTRTQSMTSIRMLPDCNPVAASNNSFSETGRCNAQLVWTWAVASEYSRLQWRQKAGDDRPEDVDGRQQPNPGSFHNVQCPLPPLQRSTAFRFWKVWVTCRVFSPQQFWLGKLGLCLDCSLQGSSCYLAAQT